MDNNRRDPPTIFEVAIIGSGPAGLVTAKTLLVDHKVTNIVVFEETSSAGGLWNRESSTTNKCSSKKNGIGSTTDNASVDDNTIVDGVVLSPTTINAPTHVLRLAVPCLIHKGNEGGRSEIGEGGDVSSGDNHNSNENRTVQSSSSQQLQEKGITIRIPSSSQPVYDDLRPNFPKDMTSFLGYPFLSKIENFPPASVVDAYYKGYGHHCGVDKVTKYYTRVVDCRKEKYPTTTTTTTTTARVVGRDDDGRDNVDDGRDEDSPFLWTIDTIHTITGEYQTFRAKRLVVCNGHFRKAFAPYVPGLEYFTKGQILHSSAFRSVTDLQEHKTILIVGGSISGWDISNKLLTAGITERKVVLSIREWKSTHNVLIPSLQKRGLIVLPGIDHIDSDGRVHFGRPIGRTAHKYNADDDNDDTTASSTLQPDVILFATGYRYDFPFLKKSVRGGGLVAPHVVRDDGYKMEGLYKRILSVEDLSLAFIGVTNINFSPAIVMEYQARWYGRIVVQNECRSLTNNKEVMIHEIESRQCDRTQDALALKFPTYCNSLAADIYVSGYWTQVICYRLPLFLRTIWVRRYSGDKEDSKHCENASKHNNSFLVSEPGHNTRIVPYGITARLMSCLAVVGSISYLYISQRSSTK
jgi:cation diffusion facilitator CzcD-associated flavoprotein CzcO